MEPKDRNSPEWLEWKIRHTSGGTTFEIIRSLSLDNLKHLRRFIDFLIGDKESNQPRSFLVSGFVLVTIDGEEKSRPINKYFDVLNHDKALQAALNWKEQQVRSKHPEAKEIKIEPLSNLAVRRQKRKTKTKAKNESVYL